MAVDGALFRLVNLRKKEGYIMFARVNLNQVSVEKVDEVINRGIRYVTW